ncbi:MAG TPA: PAS domain S-box protein [Sulfurimonas sp.]
MVDLLKKKSLFAYLIITLIITADMFLILFFIQQQKNSGHTINLAGKQRMLIQRVALLSNNYFDQPDKNEIKDKIFLSLQDIKRNQNFITNLKNSTVENLLYDPLYQYDNLLNQYIENIIKFLNEPNHKLIKIINFTNESLLSISDTLVTLLANENDKKIQNIIYLVIFSTIAVLIILFLIYKKITLVSINQIDKNIKALNEEKTFISTILENSAHAIITTDLDGKITLFNKKAEEMLGYSAEELLFKETPEIFHKKEEVVEKAERLKKQLGVDIELGFNVFVKKSELDLPNIDEWAYIRKDGTKLYVKISITKLKDSNGTHVGYIGFSEDISALKEDETKIKKYVELIDKYIITSTTDLNGNITYVSDAFCKISGYSKEELIGKSHNIVRHPDMPKELYKNIWKHLLNNKSWSGEIKNRKKDGSFYWVIANISPIYDNDGNKIGYTAIRQDITDKKYIEQISLTDGLTQIYNRRHFDNVFPRMLKRNKRDKSYINFLIMDVDHFKQYNDTYGHQMGDNVLIKIANSLKESLKREDDLCFRLGGEEFGAVYYTDSQSEALLYANKIRKNIEALKIEHEKNSASKYVTASMGLICLKPDEIKSEDIIYKEADELLYKAKESGRNRVVIKDEL